jgi:glycosyltransferase involved in cell wall biosynthesis
MATELAKDRSFAVSFVVRGSGLPQGEEREGVAIHDFVSPGPGLPWTAAVRHARALWRLLREIDPHIVIQRAAGALTGELALYCARHRRVFVYMVAHDYDLGTARPPWWQRGARGAASWALYRLGLRLASRVIVQHAGQAAALRALTGRGGTLRPCVQRFPAPLVPPRERFVLWVARAEPWKQPEVFLELATAFPDERFVMVCPPAESDPGFARSVREQAARLPNVEFLGYVPFPETERLFARALLFVNTSRGEGFPNTFVQAWKHGTPVVSLAVDPEGAIMAHGLGEVCDGSVSRLREALASLLADPARREACSRSAVAYAARRHDIRVQIEYDKADLRAAWKERLGPGS